MSLNTVASILSAQEPSTKEIKGICIDSRLVEPGHLFIAVKGERFDGHDFLIEVEAKGAIAAVVDHLIKGVSIPQLVVPNTVDALAKIAKAHSQTLHCPVIALTGSNGKTTVKEMIAAILPAPSLATKGNFNNHIGAPLSVLRLNDAHRYAVFELGANHIGEIAHTVDIVQPDVTLINNIAPAHVAEFGSIERVAQAKGEIHQGLSPQGTAVINDDDAYAHFWDEILVNKKTIHFSMEQQSDVYAQDVRLDDQGIGLFSLVLPKGRADIRLQVPGLHNVRNALAAAACCYAVGLSIEEIKKGLEQFSGVKGRLTFLAGKNHSTVIDDTYNANLRSVLTALEVLAKREGKKIFVFGDMGELGSGAKEHHEEVGLTARQLGIDQLMSCGTHSAFAAEAFGVGGQHYSSQDELAQIVLKELNPETTVLVKGSRSSAMEKIVSKLLN